MRERLSHWRERMIQELTDRPEGFCDGKTLIPGREYKPVCSCANKPDARDGS